MSTGAQNAGALPYPEARRILEEHARGVTPLGSERVPLLAAAGRILAQPVSADRDFPPFPRATRDGFAVRAADVANPPAKLRVRGQVRAGSSLDPAVKLAPGECVEIMTGAPVPEPLDAVIMVEYTARRGQEVELKRSLARGDNIVPTGSEARAGDVLLAPGARLAAPQLAVAAAVGLTELKVGRKPRVAILSTGDEVVEITARPGPHQIRNSNSYSLAAQVHEAGAEPVQLPIAPDDPARLRQLIAEGLHADLLVLSGGVSMGKYDLVEDVLRESAAEFFFTGALIQPGKPIVFGRARGKYFFGLPGNPISTMVTFDLFARPLISALMGAAGTGQRFAFARLKSELKTKPGLTRFLVARLTSAHDSAEVELVSWQGSGDVVASAQANCYVVVPPDRDRIAAGELVSVMLR